MSEYRQLAQSIVNDIVVDIKKRDGFSEFWDSLEHEAQFDIFNDWTQIIVDAHINSLQEKIRVTKQELAETMAALERAQNELMR